MSMPSSRLMGPKSTGERGAFHQLQAAHPKCQGTDAHRAGEGPLCTACRRGVPGGWTRRPSAHPFIPLGGLSDRGSRSPWAALPRFPPARRNRQRPARSSASTGARSEPPPYRPTPPISRRACPRLSMASRSYSTAFQRRSSTSVRTYAAPSARSTFRPRPSFPPAAPSTSPSQPLPEPARLGALPTRSPWRRQLSSRFHLLYASWIRP